MRRIYGALAVAAALAATPALAQIKIGSAGPMTGSNAAFGEQLKRGAQMAVDDINAVNNTAIGNHLSLHRLFRSGPRCSNPSGRHR